MIALWRLDDRLIHGQVLAVLVPQLKIDAIVTISKAVANDPFRIELYQLACPPELPLQFVDVPKAVELYVDWQKDSKRYLLVFDNPQEMLALAKEVGPPASINLANLGFHAGRTACFDAIYLDPEEEKILRELSALGVDLYYQQVPSCATCKFNPK